MTRLLLLRPDAIRPLWIDTMQEAIDTCEERGIDLAELPGWRDDDVRPLTPDALRLGLRHGRKSKRGIVVDAFIVWQLGRPAELAGITQDALAASEKLRRDDTLMERLLPGWGEHGRKLDATIAESTRRQIEGELRRIQKSLGAAVQPELAEHWLKLGGLLPDPA